MNANASASSSASAPAIPAIANEVNEQLPSALPKSFAGSCDSFSIGISICLLTGEPSPSVQIWIVKVLDDDPTIYPVGISAFISSAHNTSIRAGLRCVLKKVRNWDISRIP